MNCELILFWYICLYHLLVKFLCIDYNLKCFGCFCSGVHPLQNHNRPRNDNLSLRLSVGKKVLLKLRVNCPTLSDQKDGERTSRT